MVYTEVSLGLSGSQKQVLSNLLGILLIALSGLKTRMVRMADMLKFSVSTAYSTVLRRKNVQVYTLSVILIYKRSTGIRKLHLSLKQVKAVRMKSHFETSIII